MHNVGGGYTSFQGPTSRDTAGQTPRTGGA
jgi:hypothetical protein